MSIGAGRATLRFRDGLPLFGFGPGGGRGMNLPAGSPAHDRLEVRALYLEHGPRKLLVLTYDLASGSRVLQQAIVRALEQRGRRLKAPEVWVVGTHTHSGPGSFLGNGYDYLGQMPMLERSTVLLELVRKGVDAAEQALSELTPCRFGVRQGVLWGCGRNRSLDAFLSNLGGELPSWIEELGVSPPDGLTPEQTAVDPRLTVVTFRRADDGRPLALWATWCCHPATFARAEERPYHRDWPGVAVDALEAHVPFAIVHQGANGDVTSLPCGERRCADPLERARTLGRAVAEACWREAAETDCSHDSFELGFADFVPEREGVEPFEFGAPTMGGSEEFDPGWLVRALGEARRLPFRMGGQRPKWPAVWPLQALARSWEFLRPSPAHPMWLLRLGPHLFFASPFEQTTYAARTLESALRGHWLELRGETIAASPIGLVGDYAGYVTTEAEFACQHYEGAHTLYGSGQLRALTRAWSRMLGPELSCRVGWGGDRFALGAWVGQLLDQL